MRMDAHAVEPARLHAWGARAALEVSAPLPGVLRVRHAPLNADASATHPHLPDKRSWAVHAPPAPGPLTVTSADEGATLQVAADGVALRVSLETGAWTLLDADGRPRATCTGVRAAFSPDYPVPRFHTELQLAAPASEAYLGFGERTGPLDRRGRHLTLWNTDVLPHLPDTDPLYASIPFCLALAPDGRAWGLLLDETWRQEVDVAQDDPGRLVWRSRGPELDAYLVTGPTPAEVLARYTQLTGRAPLPPLWALGAHQSRWGYESADEVRALVRGFRERGLPLDVVHLDIDHMDAYRVFTWDRTRFPDPEGLARELGEQGVRLVTIVDPALAADERYRPYAEAREQDLLVRSGRGTVLHGEVWPTPAAWPDFTRPEVRAWWARQHGPLFEAGVAGLWCDMNEPSCFKVLSGPDFEPVGAPAVEVGKTEGKTLPNDARHGTRRHLEVHNVYGQGMAEGAREAFAVHARGRRPFVLTRAGWAGIQRHAAVWTGDNSSYWEHLEASLAMLQGLGVSGVALCGADVPGHLGRPSAELLVRWLQAGAFYPLLRNHSAKGTAQKEPWRFGEPTLALARAALERRYRLLPHLYTLLWEARERGLPVLRPLALHFPDDLAARGASDTFLFGEGLLVAPVVRPGHTARLVHLPRGVWHAFPNLERAGARLEGPAPHAVEAPLDVTPCFLREGHALPLTAPAPHTTRALWGELTWHVAAGPEVRGLLYEDEGEGEAAGRLTRLEGGWDGQRLELVRHTEGEAPGRVREEERVVVHGLPAHARGPDGVRARRREDGGLELVLAPDWRTLTVTA